MTILNYTATQGQTDFSFASMEFDSDLSTVTLTINDVLYPLSTSEVDYDTKNISLSSGLTAGDIVRIFRNTSVDSAIVTYVDTAVLTDEDLNDMVSQLLYRMQELIEQIDSDYDPEQINYGTAITDNANRLDLIEANYWVTTLRVLDGAITRAKLADLDNMRVIGNTSGSSGAPTSDIQILDEDDMISNSELDLASQQSIKAYVDGKKTDSDDYDLNASGNEVLSGGNSLTWADLDLSAIVGTKQTIVYLKCASLTVNSGLSLRAKGDTADVGRPGSVTSLGAGASAGVADAGKQLILIVDTDANGVIQYKMLDGGTWNFELIGYQNLR